jgi:hypothetical protein
MKRIALTGSIALASGLILTACLPAISDNKRVNPILQTPVLESTPSGEFTTTKTSTASIELSSTATLIPTSQFTPIPSFTSAVEPAIEVPLIVTAIPISVTGIFISDTATPIESVGIDKLPSNTIYKPVHIQNISGKQVDITLHCTTNKGLQTILEYKNVKNLFTDLPEGDYVYVIFVGGRQLVGSFSFMTAAKLFITIHKDRVAIH